MLSLLKGDAGQINRAFTPDNQGMMKGFTSQNIFDSSKQLLLFSDGDFNLNDPGLNSSASKKPIILDEGKERYTGRLKFFDENKNYGFIIMDGDGSDIFVHFDDLSKAGVTKDMLRVVKNGQIIRFSFGCMSYIGKYNKSRKAVDIELIQFSNGVMGSLGNNLYGI